jgi:virginiamycin B lyase
MNGKILALCSLAALLVAGCSAPQTAAIPSSATYGTAQHVPPPMRGTITFYPDTLGDAVLEGIVTGPDGELWFNDEGNGVVGQMMTDGTYGLQQKIGSGLEGPSSGLTVGPDKRLWFTLPGGGVGRMTTSGQVKLFTDPQGSFPQGITTGPDGAMWFAQSDGTIGRVTMKGKITHFPVAEGDAHLYGIVTGPDGNLWVTQQTLNSTLVSNQVYRVTPQGNVTAFTVGSGPTWICVGPDKALWFTERGANAIGRLTTGGKYKEFPTNFKYGEPSGIALGPDGALWFTDFNGRFGIGRITTKGKIHFYSDASINFLEMRQIAAGPDGAMWFSSYLGPGVGRISVR